MKSKIGYGLFFMFLLFFSLWTMKYYLIIDAVLMVFSICAIVLMLAYVLVLAFVRFFSGDGVE